MKNIKKSTVLILSVVLLLAVAAGSTLAFLITKSDTVENTFKYADVKIRVDEEVKDQTKSNVKVTNTGTAGEDAAIVAHVTYVEYWTDSNGNVVSKDQLPEGYSSTTTIAENKNGWIEKNGNWYYLTAVPVNQSTPELPIKWEATTPNSSAYTWHVDILAEGLQAEPDTAYKQAWGFN